MENTNLDTLLDSLAALVSDSRGSLFGNDKCMVDRDELLNLVDALQAQIPAEIKQAKEIIESCSDLRTNAKKDAAETRKEANRILNEARERAAALIEEDNIVVMANQRRDEIMAEAEAYRDKLVTGALEYAERVVSEAETSVKTIYHALDSGIEKLNQLQKENSKEAVSKIKEARAALKSVSDKEASGK